MKILFVMRSTVYVRNFESTLRLLAERGHHVHVAAPAHRLLDDTDLIGRLAQQLPNITHGGLPERPPHGWSLLAEELRRGVDYLRYLGPAYRAAPKLRARAERTAPEFVTRLLRQPALGSSLGRRCLTAALRHAERSLPRDPAVDEFIRTHAPDLLLVTPLVEPGSPQSSYIRSARALGVRTGLCVYSWDNLTNKGLIHDALDVVTVWNERMREEAITLHRVPPERVMATGAAPYDHWFSWRPREAREAFCSAVGLDPQQPFLLYLCSSKFIAPDEVPFVRDWIRRIREGSALLRDAGVLVRPHPQNAEQWKDVDFAELPNVAIWPPAGSNPVDEQSRSQYFDSMFHSAAVVGVNSSALIESAIVGRTVCTILAPEFKDTQEGTLHFRHLVEAGGGVLQVAAEFAGHITHLEACLRVPDRQRPRDAFLQAFVRPHGLAEPATPRLVAAIEQVATAAATHDHAPFGAWMVRRLLRAAALEHEATERKRRDETLRRERAKEEKGRSLAERRAEKQAAREQVRQERRARILQERAEKARQAAARAAAAERDDHHEVARAFANYEIVRAHLRRMAVASGAPGSPQQGGNEWSTIASLQHLWQATPEVIGKLRQYTAPLTGINPADYTAASSEQRKQFFVDLSRLVKVGNPALLVPESPLLGGFGHAASKSKGQQHFNDDTLKYFEVLSALDCGAVLRGIGRPEARSIVWEIGGGWGGFAYQFKTLFPNTSYVITAPAEMLLVSAVYLMTAFPDATCRFYDDHSGPQFWQDLATTDFAFATEDALAAAAGSGAAIDLTLDLQSLEAMPRARAGAHARAAFALRSRYLYSLCPAHANGSGLTPVADVLAPLYWSYELPVPQYDGMKVLAGFRRSAPPDGVERVHRLGWKRLIT